MHSNGAKNQYSVVEYIMFLPLFYSSDSGASFFYVPCATQSNNNIIDFFLHLGFFDNIFRALTLKGHSIYDSIFNSEIVQKSVNGIVAITDILLQVFKCYA